MSEDWKLRAKAVVQRFWQPTTACMSCMPGSLGNIFSLVHWELALRTGLVSSLFVLILTFTPAIRLFRNRFGNAAIVGCLTAAADMFAHENHYGVLHAEALLTGLASFAISLAASYLVENRAQRLRTAWARLTGRPTNIV